MFTAITQLQYQRKNGRELIWSSGENTAFAATVAGAMLGSEIVRIRAIRGPMVDEQRYHLVDGAAGTLPYHSWSVVKGDESWSEFANEAETRAILEPYLQGFSFSATAMRLTQPLTSKERIYGLGERTGDMNKRDKAFPIWNVDPPKYHGPNTLTMYTSIPFYLGLRMEDGRVHGVFIDYMGLVEMDLGETNESEATMTVDGDSMVVYFFVGPTPEAVLHQYTELTGRMSLPPRWALGYQQNRWSYMSQKEVSQIASELQEHKIPCDAIWLDIDYMDGYLNFTWNPETFPNPKQLTDDLHAQGLHLITIIDPGTKVDNDYFVYKQGMEHDYFCRYDNGEIFTGDVWPGKCVFPDYSETSVREWWGNLYQLLLDKGVDGIWNDMDEPSMTNVLSQDHQPPIHGATMSLDVLHRAGGDESTGPDGPPVLHKYFHNAYGMEMARSTHTGLLRLRPDSRPFVLTRSGTAGVQRYAAIWTGDNTSEWDHILMAMPMCLNLSMSGVPFVGVDIGGFWNASNGEMLVRFTQLGALLPFCRNHSAKGNPNQEPWAFGEPYESACRFAIEQRYRLLPYLYNLFHEAATSGAAIMRPLYYHYRLDEQANEVQSEFMLGNGLLSAPIYEPGATSRIVYLPEGSTWFDYWDGTEYPGGGFSEIAAPLDRWPLIVCGNSIIPTGPVMQYTEQRTTDPLTITCYMAGDGHASYTLYEDDGTTRAYEKGAYALTTINCRVNDDMAVVEIEEHYSAYRPEREWYEVVVFIGGKELREHVKAGQEKAMVRLFR